MSTGTDVGAEIRVPLTRERVLRTAVQLADESGIEALSMRKLAQALDVVPMALYRHVANKDELLDAWSTLSSARSTRRSKGPTGRRRSE